MVINLKGELTEWLSTPEVRDVLKELLRVVVREELKTLLLDDLVDTTEAAKILNMSEAAVRKAAERGQLPCVRLGRRLRFRRADLLQR